MIRRVYLAVLVLGCIATLMISPARADKGKSKQAQRLIDEGNTIKRLKHSPMLSLSIQPAQTAIVAERKHC
jgi:hypothetical protein